MFQNYHFLLGYKPKTPPDLAIFDALVSCDIVVDLLPPPLFAPLPSLWSTLAPVAVCFEPHKHHPMHPSLSFSI